MFSGDGRGQGGTGGALGRGVVGEGGAGRWAVGGRRRERGRRRGRVMLPSATLTEACVMFSFFFFPFCCLDVFLLFGCFFCFGFLLLCLAFLVTVLDRDAFVLRYWLPHLLCCFGLHTVGCVRGNGRPLSALIVRPN